MASSSSIIKTLIYSDIFDYPLTKEEIWRFLIGKIDKKSFEKELKSLEKSEATPLGCNRSFYYFFDRKKIVEKRIQRKKRISENLFKHVDFGASTNV